MSLWLDEIGGNGYVLTDYTEIGDSPFVVHRSIYSWRRSRRVWVVSHRPSGKAAKRFHTLRDAVAFALEFDDALGDIEADSWETETPRIDNEVIAIVTELAEVHGAIIY